MKSIFFIRHAKSDHNALREDFDRPLNERGKKDAHFMAERLKKYKIYPDIIISSSAKRTLSTTKIISEKLGAKNIKTELGLYLSSIQAYLNEIHSINDKYSNVFIVGHNPTITSLCEYLSGIYVENIPTCAVFCIDFDVDRFADITNSNGKKRFFDFPKKHIV